MPSPYIRRFDKDDPRLKNCNPGDKLVDNHGVECIVDHITDAGDPVDQKGINLATGRFAKGNGLAQGRKKGSRNKLTQKLLDTMANSDVEIGEALLEIYLDDRASIKEKIQCLKILSDVVFPKTASVEMDINDNTEKSKEAIDAELKLAMLKLFDKK